MLQFDELLDIAAFIVCILGVLAALAAYAMIRRRAETRTARPAER